MWKEFFEFFYILEEDSMPDPLPENRFAQARCVIARCRTRRVAERDYAPSDRGTGSKGSNNRV